MILQRMGLESAEPLWKMQVEAFQELYEKYQDTETSPATEKLEKTVERLKQPFTYFYSIQVDGTVVGAIRIVDKDTETPKRISPLFIRKQYRGKGYAQQAIRLAEEIHGSRNWILDTILQEKGNCHLYEKMGYHQVGETMQVNDRLTLVLYIKE